MKTPFACSLIALFAAAAVGQDPGRLALETTVHPAPLSKVSQGRYTVYEDREAGSGRTLDLEVVVLHARAEDPRPDPIFWLAGGPGQNAARLYRGHTSSWMREDRDLVFVSQRGTGGNHRLDLELGGNDRDLQSYLEPLFEVDRFRAGAEILSQRADLRLYSTPIAMDDLDEVRAVLGYETVNLVGGSYGTRAGLIYLRRHPERARTAILNGVAPLEFKNPLYHAWGAQLGLDSLFDEVEADTRAREAFPHLREKFGEILERLENQPTEVTLRRGDEGPEVTLKLDRPAFCEALRVLMYYTGTNRQVPLLIHRAWEGDFEVFVERGLASSRGIRRTLAIGMLMCVTSAEDLARIEEHEIEPLTKHTFLGDDRVRQQKACAAIWPQSRLPAGFGEPVDVDVPVLILSGTHDPVTPPEFGHIANRNLPRSIHVVVPGCHGVGGRQVSALQRQFLEEASVDDLDLSVLEGMRMPPLTLETP